VEVDRGRLEQVIMNLVLNARDAMPDGGALSITAEIVEPAATDIPDPASGGYVKISVADTGTGMSNEEQAHVFEPFFTTKPRGEGTGLGLSTVDGIVAQSGGHVAVSSHVGEGTTFVVYLPLVAPPPTPGAATMSPGVPQVLPAGGTILLVEDETAVRGMEALVLETAGYRVLQAKDGFAGLEVAARHSGEISIVVTDVLMPRLSGPDLVDRLLAAHPKIKILFTSGYTEDALNESRIGDKTPFLAKPFSASRLLAAVSGILQDSPPSVMRDLLSNNRSPTREP
jgi:two-component system cell cycle sensor histidine kinase/response regulator CckA